MQYSLLRFMVMLLLGVLWLGGPAAAQTQETVLTASDGEGNDRFGRSVTLSADGATALVAGHQDEIGGMDPPNGIDSPEGSAYIFTRDALGTWTEQAKLTASDATGGDAFGWAAALSADGTVALLGANGDEFGRGSAYVFIRMSDGSWVEQAKLVASDGADFDAFGASVALNADGSVALIGATNAAIEGEQMGSAYVFTSDGTGNWTQQAKLTGSDLIGEGFGGEKFGQAVALDDDGTTALVGANEDPIDGNDEQGSAFVFTDDGAGNWTEQAKLTASDGSAEDQFGWSVSLNADGSVALVGRLDELADGDQGSAYVFTRGGSGMWTEQARLAPPSAAGDDRFGFSVSLNSDGTVALASSREDQGSAYVFSRDGGGTWSQTANFVPSESQDDDSFGQSVSIDAKGERALVGAPRHDIDGATDEGSAYVFALSDGTAAPSVTTEAATNVAETSAQLNGRVNPNGAETTVSFVYYPTGQPGQGQTVAADQSPLTGETEQEVSATAEFLQGDTEYTFLVSAENSEGLVNGSELAFTTGGGANAVTIEVTETIGVSGEVDVTPPATVTVTEAIGVSDEVQVTPPAHITVTESIGVSDEVRVAPPVQITVTESIGVFDEVEVQLPVVITVTEAIGVSDQVSLTASVLGDVTGDGDVVPFDASQILKHAVGLLQLEGLKLWAADVSGQAGVTPLDASLVLQFYVGQIDCFPAAADCEVASKRAGAFVAGELAWGTPRFTGGDAVELPLVLEGAEGVTALDVTIDVDPAAFEVLSVASGLEGDGTVVHRAEGDELHLAAAAAGALEGEVAVVQLRRSQDDRRVALEGTWTPNEGAEQMLRAAPVPERYALEENYPNPFNPETIIRYKLPESADVRLTVFDELGQEVAVLVDERRPAGRYEVTFDAGHLASGVYLYQLEADDFRETRTMVLVK